MIQIVKEVIKSKSNEAWSYIVFEASRDADNVIQIPDNKPIMTSVVESLDIQPGDKVAV